MAIGLHSDLTRYNEQVQAGFMQRQAQMLDAILPNVAGSVVIETAEVKGDYGYAAVFDNGPSITRRDLTTSAAQTATALGQDEDISVKLNFKYPLVEVTKSSFRNQGLSPELFFFMLGSDYAEKKIKYMLNQGHRAANAALTAAANTNDQTTAGSGPATVTPALLNTTNLLLGDHSGDIVAYWLHSNSWHGLIGQAISDKVTDIANIAIRNGVTFALGRNFVMSDFPAAVDTTPIPDSYFILGLTPGAVMIKESEPDEVAVVPTETGGENLTMRFQGEGAFNVSVKGFKWDVANGGANPTDATLATQTNWDLYAGDVKQTAGVRLAVDITT